MNNYVINIMNKYGYLGILFLITIENIFPPIPKISPSDFPSKALLVIEFANPDIGINAPA